MISPYDVPSTIYDEVFSSDGSIRPHYKSIAEHFSIYDADSFNNLADEAKHVFLNEGITFAVYANDTGVSEQIFPFDLIPRLITTKEWKVLKEGILQRNLAINDFLSDIYSKQRIINEKVIPRDLIESSVHFLKSMIGVKPNGGIFNHISGSDVIRHSDGHFYILEDNVRSPSGVSYVIANRRTMKKTFSTLFSNYKPKLVDNYSSNLLEMLQSVGPKTKALPNCVVLTPGVYNSAYYEHAWLAQSMGIELVEGRDMLVENDFVYAKTIYGPVKVDVIYRRIDDQYIDPNVFKKDSLLGIPGLMNCYIKGNVTLVNAPGTGVADDKAVYNYMPEIIKFYRDEEPILKNIKTYRCEIDEDYNFVMQNIDKLVVKPVDESGGYGISIGNTLNDKQISEVQKNIKENRRKYIAQPIMSLSTHPTYIKETKTIEGRYLDLRTFCLLGKNFNHVVPGGLTRVALQKGNLIVNSSQGGGSKDTWVVDYKTK